MCDVWILKFSWNFSCLLRFPSVLALILKMYRFVHLRSLSFFQKKRKVRHEWVCFAVTEVGWSSFLGQRRDMKLKWVPVMITKRYFPDLKFVSVHNGCVSRSSRYRNLVSINANNKSSAPKWWSSINKSYPFSFLFLFLFCEVCVTYHDIPETSN